MRDRETATERETDFHHNGYLHKGLRKGYYVYHY